MILIINDHGCSVRKGRYCHNIACISVVVIATIVIPIVVIYSGGESTKNSTKIPTTITTTQTTTTTTTTTESTSDMTGGGTVLAEFRILDASLKEFFNK